MSFRPSCDIRMDELPIALRRSENRTSVPASLSLPGALWAGEQRVNGTAIATEVSRKAQAGMVIDIDARRSACKNPRSGEADRELKPPYVT